MARKLIPSRKGTPRIYLDFKFGWIGVPLYHQSFLSTLVALLAIIFTNSYYSPGNKLAFQKGGTAVVVGDAIKD